jgi:hypothetical protein
MPRFQSLSVGWNELRPHEWQASEWHKDYIGAEHQLFDRLENPVRPTGPYKK